MQDKLATAERPWHAETAEVALERCRSSAQGLTSAEAAERLEANGPNRLPAGKPRSLAARLFAQVNNLLIYVLLASALIAFLLAMASIPWSSSAWWSSTRQSALSRKAGRRRRWTPFAAC
jgi:magnesium-transporting ATPase (P-type)